MAEKKYTKKDCLKLLQKKAVELSMAGEERFPRRSDFSSEEVVAIKAQFGPFPRALEAAGLKERGEGGRAQKNREKRIRAKRARIAALKEEKKGKSEIQEKENLPSGTEKKEIDASVKGAIE